MASLRALIDRTRPTLAKVIGDMRARIFKNRPVAAPSDDVAAATCVAVQHGRNDALNRHHDKDGSRRRAGIIGCRTVRHAS